MAKQKQPSDSPLRLGFRSIVVTSLGHGSFRVEIYAGKRKNSPVQAERLALMMTPGRLQARLDFSSDAKNASGWRGIVTMKQLRRAYPHIVEANPH